MCTRLRRILRLTILQVVVLEHAVLPTNAERRSGHSPNLQSIVGIDRHNARVVVPTEVVDLRQMSAMGEHPLGRIGLLGGDLGTDLIQVPHNHSIFRATREQVGVYWRPLELADVRQTERSVHVGLVCECVCGHAKVSGIP